MDIKNIKSRLDSNEIIELHNGEDLALVSKSKITGDYLLIFNAKPLFGYKTFATFQQKTNDKIKQYRLKELISEE